MRVLQMERALSLLLDPAISLSAVAAEAGFSDQSHMTVPLPRRTVLRPPLCAC